MATGLPPSGLLPDQNGLLLGIKSKSEYKWIQSYGGDLSLNPQGNNVGIGTTNPTNALTVKGMIETVSTSGGITFPDGTIQNTATLKGDKGDQGIPGTNGSNGTNGLAGPPGPLGPPVKTSAACNIGGGICSVVCNARTIVMQSAPCEVTSETGKCRIDGNLGTCCVCGG